MHMIFDPWAEVNPSVTHSQQSMHMIFDPWAEVLPAFTQDQQTQVVLRDCDAKDSDALKVALEPNAQHQQQLWSVATSYDIWGEVISSPSHASVEAPVRSSGAEVLAPALERPAPARRRGAPVKYLDGANATRRISDKINRERRLLEGDSYVPNSVGRRQEKFDRPHLMKRQNYTDKQEGLAISEQIGDPMWQARLQAHSQTKQGKKQMGTLAVALNTSKNASTMIENCNEMLKGVPQAAVTFDPEELKRLYPAEVVAEFTMQQCDEKLRRLGVRAPDNTLKSMRTTLVRIGITGSIVGEAGVRTGGRHRAELAGKLARGMTAQDAAKLLPSVPAKYIAAAKSRSETAFISTLGENYASNTTKEKISQFQADVCVDYFKSITDFKSGAGAHTKSRILTKQRHMVCIEFYATYPKLLRKWGVANPLEKNKIDEKQPELRSKFEVDVVAAASHAEYDKSSTEEEIRRAMALQEYQSRLKRNATTQRKFGRLRPSSKGQPLIAKAKLDELLNRSDAPEYLKTSTPGQNPCSEEVFWKILSDNDIKFTTKVRATICPIHSTGPNSERDLVKALVDEEALKAKYNCAIGLLSAQQAQARQQEEGIQDQDVERALSACTAAVNNAKEELVKMSHKVLELQKKVDIYIKHLAQFNTSRAEVNKIMESLGPDECLVYRDFVNQHSWFDNRKVCNLVLVVIWKENGHLRSMKLNNFCSDEDSLSTDPYYVRDVFDFHMKPKSVQHGYTGLLSRFKKIYISGHGCIMPMYIYEATSDSVLQVTMVLTSLLFRRCSTNPVCSETMASIRTLFLWPRTTASTGEETHLTF